MVRACMRADLLCGVSASDRETPLITGVNGTLMARQPSPDLRLPWSCSAGLPLLGYEPNDDRLWASHVGLARASWSRPLGCGRSPSTWRVSPIPGCPEASCAQIRAQNRTAWSDQLRDDHGRSRPSALPTSVPLTYAFERVPVRCSQVQSSASAMAWNNPRVDEQFGRGSESFVVRSAVWVQVLFWINFAVGAVGALVGLAGLVAPGLGKGLAVVFLLPGLVMAIVTGFGVRMGVRCNRNGIRLRRFRTTFVPVGEIGSVRPVPVVGSPGLARGMIAVIRRDGSEVRLDPTLAVRMSQASVDARLQALAARMTAVLGLEAPTGRTDGAASRQDPPSSHA